MTLLVAPCSRDAAAYAVKNWHYARSMPLGRCVTFGAWWAGEYRGAVVFARGNNLHLGRPYGLPDPRHVVELCRVALTQHPEFAVTAVVARALRLLRATQPGLRLVVSFADPEQDHDGSIYRAGNWMFLGRTDPGREFFYQGRWCHQRDVTGAAQFHSRASGVHDPDVGGHRPTVDPATLPSRELLPKYRYGYPLDRAMRRTVTAMAVPFPRGQRLDGEPAPSHGEGPGSTPGGRS